MRLGKEGLKIICSRKLRIEFTTSSGWAASSVSQSAAPVSAQVRVRIPASLDFFRLYFRCCMSCVFTDLRWSSLHLIKRALCFGFTDLRWSSLHLIKRALCFGFTDLRWSSLHLIKRALCFGYVTKCSIL